MIRKGEGGGSIVKQQETQMEAQSLTADYIRMKIEMARVLRLLFS